MPDYSAVFLPGLLFTSTALTAVTGGDPVEVAGPNQVQKCTNGPGGVGSLKFIGMASADAAAGALATIIAARPVFDGLADGTITAGDQLQASPVAGRQVRTVPPTSGAPTTADVDQARAVIGVALTSAATGQTCRWMHK